MLVTNSNRGVSSVFRCAADLEIAEQLQKYTRFLTSRSARVTQRVTTHLYLGRLFFFLLNKEADLFRFASPLPFPF
jgi:hypothetical protein